MATQAQIRTGLSPELLAENPFLGEVTEKSCWTGGERCIHIPVTHVLQLLRLKRLFKQPNMLWVVVQLGGISKKLEISLPQTEDPTEQASSIISGLVSLCGDSSSQEQLRILRLYVLRLRPGELKYGWQMCLIITPPTGHTSPITLNQFSDLLE